MGYDAIAYRVKKDGGLGDCISPETMTPEEKVWFTDASNTVKDICGCVDYGLDKGYLDCRVCGEVLNSWIGTDINDMNTPITPERISKRVIPSEVLEDAWVFRSVKMFLEGCQKFGYAVLNCW